MSRRKDTLRLAATGQLGALRWSVVQRTEDALANHILIIMACPANSSWVCFMTLPSIAEKVECSVKTVGRKIQHLLLRGYIEDISDQYPERRTRTYRLCADQELDCA